MHSKSLLKPMLTRMTKFMTPAAYGTCVAAITFTKGLPPVPACVHGTMASIAVMTPIEVVKRGVAL